MTDGLRFLFAALAVGSGTAVLVFGPSLWHSWQHRRERRIEEFWIRVRREHTNGPGNFPPFY